MSNIKAIKRDNVSTGSNNKLRAEGLIPAILYGGKNPNQNISIEKKAIKTIVNSDTFLSKVLELDIDGKKVRTLLNRFQSEGYNTIIWNGKNDSNVRVAAGMYLYTLLVEDMIQTRKMVMLK